MLGITVNDAIIIGALVASCIAGWLGRKSGDALAKVKPIEPVASGVAAGFVDRDEMRLLRLAAESIAATLKELVGIQTDEHDRAVEDRLERIEAAVLKKHDDDDRATRTVDRATDRMSGRKPRD